MFAASLKATPPPADDTPLPGQLLREGVALHDSGDYEGALAKYRQVLASDPRNTLALYESSVTLFAKKDWKGCIEMADAGLRLDSSQKADFYVSGGNCRDASGDRKGAIKFYRKGLREFPRDARIGFNLAVTYAGGGDLGKAEETLESALRGDPTHPSANFLIAQIYENQRQRVPALLAYLRYLTLDAESERAKAAAEGVRRLATQGVTEKGGGDVTISVDPDSMKGDFATFELILSLQAASRHLKENNEGTTEMQSLAASVDLLAGVAQDLKLADKSKCFPCQQYLPLFLELKEKGWLEPFTYIALAKLDLPGAMDWRTANSAKVDEVKQWLAGRATQEGQ